MLTEKAQDELRRLSVEIRILEETAQALQSRMNVTNAVIQDLTYADSTLTGLEEKSEGSELLIPIGGNSYIRAALQNPDKVIVGMGAGVSMEKTSEEAKMIIKKRLENLEKAKTSIQQRFTSVAQKINEDQIKLNEMISKFREPS
ncbi:MAG: prefoldin subunit alpha [Candidatus Bathyarchaeota archaeon]|jgi:prefoldin alpha subunit